MSLNTDTVKGYVGRTVMDEYGRVFGRIVGFLTGLNRTVTSLGVELSSGEFLVVPVTQTSIDDDSIVATYPWKAGFTRLLGKFDTLLLKMRVLEKLHSEGEVSEDVYVELCRGYEAHLKGLAEERSRLIDILKERGKRLEDRIRELKLFISNVKISREIGDIDDKTYKTTNEAVQTILDRDLSEKREIDAMVEAAVRNLTIPSPSAESSKPDSHGRAKPIVLRIKDVKP